MDKYFSKRYKQPKELGLTNKIITRLLVIVNEAYKILEPMSGEDLTGGFYEECPYVTLSDLAVEHIERKYGEKNSSSIFFEDFVRKEENHTYFFDVIEVISERLNKPENLENWALYQREINNIFKEESLNWHLSDDKIVKLASDWVMEEIYDPVIKLLRKNDFPGVEHEFQKARNYLTQGDYNNAILNASHAIESTIKTILDIDKPPNFEASLKKLYEAKIIPEYHEKFLEAFEKIIRPVIQMRNEEKGVGHGQGKEVNQPPESLAELAVNLAGVIILYIVKCHNEKPETA